jgi:hypothetical protein
MTITKENFSHTIYQSWNTSNTYDFSGIPGFFPIVNNDTINFTYYMDTHNLSSEFNQTVFLFPFKPHTEQLGNAILPVKTPEDIFPGFFSYILISCSITCSVLSCAYLYFRNRQQERQRERNNEHWRLYNQTQAREAFYESMQQISEAHNQEPLPSNTHLPENYADYHYVKQTPRENLQQNIDYYRDQGYWTKIINISPKTSIIYVSNWRQDQVGERGIPEWRRPRRRQQN